MEYKVTFCELDQKSYDTNEHLASESFTTEYFGEGYTIKDFYGDRANVCLEEMDGQDGWYRLQTADDETRYVFVKSIENTEER